MKKVSAFLVFAILAAMAFGAIGEAEALSIAASSAGISVEDIPYSRVHLERERGGFVYDLEFWTEAGKWEYEVDSESGRVVSSEFEAFENLIGTVVVTREEAEKIALEDASLDRSSVRNLRTETDEDDGILYYEISFISGEWEYEYEIDSLMGAIHEAKKEKRGRLSEPRSSRIGVDEAGNIAYHALSLSGMQTLHMSEDRDDGRYEYKARIWIDKYQYEVEISGGGDVRSISKEWRPYRYL